MLPTFQRSGRHSRRALPSATPARKQRGQALVYGLFVLISGLAALFYLFNVGQLSHEKTRLVNTADAVAYSGGLVEARTMNFAAYTNRALVANEVAIAQTVSMASWLEYMDSHGQAAVSFNCATYPAYSLPAVRLMLARYLPACVALALAQVSGTTSTTKEIFLGAVPPLMAVTELVKASLQAASAALLNPTSAGLPPLSVLVRKEMMDQVAEANYRDLGKVHVQHLANTVLRDDFTQYGSGDNKRLVIESYTRGDQGGDQRQRIADAVVRSVQMDGFTPQRSWNDKGFPPGCWWNWSTRPRLDRSGGTQLVNYDEWRASDSAVYREYYPRRWFRCRSSSSRVGYGSQSTSAAGGASTADWGYSGIPNYLDLNSEALQSPDPRLVYAVQLRRPLDQTSTSEGRSEVRNSDRINPYRATPAADQSMFGLSGVEVFFQRPTARVGAETELPSLFNPYWQTRLVELPVDVKRKALALLAVTGS